MTKTKIIHPHPNETYRVGYDDGCVIVSSGSEAKNDKRIYLSKSMVEWLYKYSLRKIK